MIPGWASPIGSSTVKGKRSGRKKATKQISRSSSSRQPIVALVAWQIARKLQQAGISRAELIEGLEEQRAQLFRERYPDWKRGDQR